MTIIFCFFRTKIKQLCRWQHLQFKFAREFFVNRRGPSWCFNCWHIHRRHCTPCQRKLLLVHRHRLSPRFFLRKYSIHDPLLLALSPIIKSLALQNIHCLFGERMHQQWSKGTEECKDFYWRKEWTLQLWKDGLHFNRPLLNYYYLLPVWNVAATAYAFLENRDCPVSQVIDRNIIALSWKTWQSTPFVTWYWNCK